MAEIINLSEPSYSGLLSVEECIRKRSSVREYRETPLTLEEVSQLLWSAQGLVSEKTLRRTAPSAGATYPLFLYLVCGQVRELAPGVYRYEPQNHSLKRIYQGDIRAQLCDAALGQSCIRRASISIVVAANYRRTTARYGERGKRYVWIEVGHVGENIYLECESLKLGTVAVGAFQDSMVKEVLHLPPHEDPLYIMPVGRKTMP